MNYSELTAKSFALRRDVLDMVYHAKSGHIGGDFSVMDILITLYYLQMNISKDNLLDPERDRLILSKGHTVEVLYAILADKEFFDRSSLLSFMQYGTSYIGHPTKRVNGIEVGTGSLGHGLSFGVGMAIAGKMDNMNYRVYVVMGDGELGEGSVWEGAMAASHYRLDNLTAIIDRNRLQISGTTEEVMPQENLVERWTAFGWNVIKVNGHRIDEINEAINLAKETKNKPTIIIADTIKGYGYSKAENQLSWHHLVPDKNQYEEAMLELRQREVNSL